MKCGAHAPGLMYYVTFGNYSKSAEAATALTFPRVFDVLSSAGPCRHSRDRPTALLRADGGRQSAWYHVAEIGEHGGSFRVQDSIRQ